MYKFIIFIGILIGMYYYVNLWSDGWLTSIITSAPKMIAFGVAIIALMFPRDYDKIPDMIKRKIC